MHRFGEQRRAFFYEDWISVIDLYSMTPIVYLDTRNTDSESILGADPAVANVGLTG